MKFIQGNKVAFSPVVLRRCGYEKALADMRGIVLEVSKDGKIAQVDTHGTYCNEEGNPVRSIPTANLTKILANGVVFGD